MKERVRRPVYRSEDSRIILGDWEKRAGQADWLAPSKVAGRVRPSGRARKATGMEAGFTKVAGLFAVCRQLRLEA